MHCPRTVRDMQARADSQGQPAIPAHHRPQPERPAARGNAPRQPRLDSPQQHGGPARQAAQERRRVGQAPGVRDQPDTGHRLAGAGPGIPYSGGHG